MEVTGIIKVINEVQHVSDKFRKRDFVVTVEGTYPQHILIQLTQDKTELINNYKVGDEVKVSINLRGREWNGPEGVKYFNSIEGWRIENLTQNEGHDANTTFKPANLYSGDMPF